MFQKVTVLCGLNFLRVPLRQSVPSLLVQERTAVLLVSVLAIGFPSYKSLLLNIVLLFFPLKNILVLPSPRWFVSLVVSW